MSEDWGPWIEHDGKGCPLPKGTFFHAVGASGREEVAQREHGPGVPPPHFWCYWAHDTLPAECFPDRVIRYRIRRPRALQKLVELVETLPAPEPKIAEPA